MEEGGFEKLPIGCQRWMSKISAFKSQLIVQGSAKTTAEDKENVHWHQLLKDRRVPSRTPAEKKKKMKRKLQHQAVLIATFITHAQRERSPAPAGAASIKGLSC